MSSKISVIGTGKTGSKVVQLLGENLGYAFDENTPPTIDKLKESDALIIFVPGIAVSEIFDMVLESGVPTAWGSTGFDWPQDLRSEEHTSALQSRSELVCRLLLEKKQQ